MSESTEFPAGFFPNDEADTHCLQACYQMVLANQAGVLVSIDDAERDTGYSPPLLTWQFAMLLSLAERYNLYSIDFENFDAATFADDPIAELSNQIDDQEALESQIAGSDLQTEARRAQRCLADPRIQFRQGLPSMEDLRRVVASGASVICLVNGAALLEVAGYRPHFVMVRSVDSSSVIVDDPGPKPRPLWELPIQDFTGAWLNPNESVANFVACSRSPITIP